MGAVAGTQTPGLERPSLRPVLDLEASRPSKGPPPRSPGAAESGPSRGLNSL